MRDRILDPKTTDMNIFDIVENMSQEFPWLSQCANHFEVSDIGENHDLMNIFQLSEEDEIYLLP